MDDTRGNFVCLHHSGLVKWIEAVCLKIDEREKIVNIQLSAIEKALGVASREMERRLEGMNEFREQLSKQASTFASIKEVTTLINNIEDKNRQSVSELSKLFNNKLDNIAKDIDEIQSCVSTNKGSDRWKDHILTVLIALAVMFTVQYIFKF